MKTKILTILIILVGLCAAGFFVYKNTITREIYCDKLKEQTFTLLDQGNYCDVDSDCMVESGGLCPFGCYYLVNKNADLIKIDEALRKFSKDCFYCVYEYMEAPTAEEIKCTDHKCVATLP